MFKIGVKFFKKSNTLNLFSNFQKPVPYGFQSQTNWTCFPTFQNLYPMVSKLKQIESVFQLSKTRTLWFPKSNKLNLFSNFPKSVPYGFQSQTNWICFPTFQNLYYFLLKG